MIETRRLMETGTITGMDAEGRNVTVPLASVLSLVPDPDRLAWTKLHSANGIVLVEGEYEGWMDRMATTWTRNCKATAS